MRYKEVIEVYGKEMVDELVDYAMINRGSNADWLHFSKKYGVVGKTTKEARGYVSFGKAHFNFNEDGTVEEHHTPREYFIVKIKNGRGNLKLDVIIFLDEVKEE